MYTFSKAIKDSKGFLNTEESKSLLSEVGNINEELDDKRIGEAIDSVYKIFLSSLFMDGKMMNAYIRLRKPTDRILISEVVADKLIPILVLFKLCEHYTDNRLSTVRQAILALINTYISYIECDNIEQEDYNKLKNMKLQ